MSLPKSKFHDLLLTSHVCVLALGVGFLNSAGVVVWYKVCIPDSGSPVEVLGFPYFIWRVLYSLWGSDIRVQRPTRSSSGLAGLWGSWVGSVEGGPRQSGRDKSPQGRATNPETEGTSLLDVTGACKVFRVGGAS